MGLEDDDAGFSAEDDLAEAGEDDLAAAELEEGPAAGWSLSARSP